MRIEHRAGGWWIVGSEMLVGPYDTNAAAWRAMDRIENAPLSRAEAVTDWRLDKEMKGQ